MNGQLTEDPTYYCVKEDSATQLAQGSWQASGHWRHLKLPYPKGVGTYRLATPQDPFRVVPYEQSIMVVIYTQASATVNNASTD